MKYRRLVNFLGRNGYFKQSGIEILKDNMNIHLFPLTSRNDIARCEIQIPKEDLHKFITQLQTFL